MENLSPSKQAVLNFVRRYRLATNHTLAVQTLTGVSRNAVAKCTARMCKDGLLKRFSLFPPENYFRIGPAACSLMGIASRHSEPLGPQALCIDYATLIYANNSEAHRRRLTAEELNQYTPWLPEELARAPYCIDSEGCLTAIRVDLGGSAQHVARKVAAFLDKSLQQPELTELVARSQFQLSILTTSREKAKVITDSLQKGNACSQVRYHIVAVPLLSYLLLQSR